jgi:hypothetical protein
MNGIVAEGKFVEYNVILACRFGSSGLSGWPNEEEATEN